MTTDRDTLGPEILPVPDRPRVGLVTYDAKDPDTSFPTIKPLRVAITTLWAWVGSGGADLPACQPGPGAGHQRGHLGPGRGGSAGTDGHGRDTGAGAAPTAGQAPGKGKRP
jgi:hypothetical protein